MSPHKMKKGEYKEGGREGRGGKHKLTS